MRMNFSKFRFFALAFVTIVIFSVMPSVQSNNKIDPGSIFFFDSSILEEHAPIAIESDEDFLSFPGSGTIKDPYLIENYNITSNSLFGIYICSTTKHFLIRNCYVDVELIGISIDDIFEGSVRIENNIISNSEEYTGKGISIYFATEVVIKNNIIDNHESYGLVLAGIDASYIVGNSFSNNGETGMITAYVRNIGIFENEYNDNEKGGICVFETESAMIKMNECSRNGEEGVHLEETEGVIFLNNTIEENGIWGIRMIGVEGSLLKFNLFKDNRERGLFLDENCRNNWIYQNDFINSSRTGYSQGRDEGEANRWYDAYMKTGNFWDDLGDELEYSLDGTSSSVDLYPLREGNVVETQINNETDLLNNLNITGFLLILPALLLRRRKQLKSLFSSFHFTLLYYQNHQHLYN